MRRLIPVVLFHHDRRGTRVLLPHPSCFTDFVDQIPARLPRRRGRPGFLAGWPAQAWGAKSGGDDDAPQLDGHVVVGGFGLRGVPAGPSPMTGHVVGGVSVQGVPDGDDAEADQPKRHGPFDGAACPIAGLAYADDLAGVGEGLLDHPPRRVAGHQIFRGGARTAGVTTTDSVGCMASVPAGPLEVLRSSCRNRPTASLISSASRPRSGGA